MPFADLQEQKEQLLLKATNGSCFVGAVTVPAVTTLTTYTPPVTGPPAVPASIDVTPLPLGMSDLGLLTEAGMGFSRDTANSETRSFGRTTPTRTDVTSDTDTLVVVAQETKLITIGMATGADLAAIVADPDSGEVSFAKADRPRPKHYRVLAVAQDENEFGEILIARYMPNAKVTNYAEQAFAAGDDVIGWGVTFTAEKDSTLGYATRYLFGGAGWKGLLTAMGIPDED